MDSLFAPWRMDWIRRDERNEAIDGCVFCGLPEHNHREHRIAAYSERAFVLLNKSPYNPGHVLVIPRRHVASVSDLDTNDIAEVFGLVKRTTRALELALAPDGFNVGMNIGAAGGASIDDHIHVHVVPRWRGDTTFMPTTANTRLVEEALDETYERIRDAFGSLDGTEDEGASVRVPSPV
jgi:ATP adenylyltransferase